MNELEWAGLQVYQSAMASAHLAGMLKEAHEREKMLRDYINDLNERIEEVANAKRGKKHPKKKLTNWVTAFNWGLDYCRAMRKRPKLIRFALRLLMGRYAYREFIGLQDALEQEGFTPYSEYSIEGVDYHKDHTPSDYAEKREPLIWHANDAVDHAQAAGL